MAFITGTFIKVKLACHKMIKEYSDLKNIKGKGLFNHLGFPLDSTLPPVVRREFTLSDSFFFLINKHCQIVHYISHSLFSLKFTNPQTN